MSGPHRNSNTGFTIVELLIVIVVIAILAAITIISYNGIQSRTRAAVVQADVSSGIKILEAYKINNNDSYPATASIAQAAGLKSSGSNTLSYTYNANTNNYCLAVSGAAESYYSTSVTKDIKTGSCGTIDGLVAWWQLNGDVKDYSGYGNDGTLSGNVSTVAGASNDSTALTFGASPACVNVPFNTTKPYHLPTGDLTIVAWVKPTTTAGAVVIRLGNGSNEQYGLFTSSGGPRFEWYNGTGFSSVSAASGVTTNSWTAIAATRTAANAITLYANGSSVATGTFTSAPATPSGFQIGSSAACGTNQIFPGAIDDVRIYNKALSASEIQSIYQGGAQ